MQNFLPKKKKKETRHDMCIWMFSITLLYSEKNYMNFFVYDGGVLTIFGEGTFVFNFMGYGLVTKSLEAECTFE
jgi:hypothetical protein